MTREDQLKLLDLKREFCNMFHYIRNKVRKNPYFRMPGIKNQYLCGAIKQLAPQIKKLRYFYDEIIKLEPEWEQYWIT